MAESVVSHDDLAFLKLEKEIWTEMFPETPKRYLTEEEEEKDEDNVSDDKEKNKEKSKRKSRDMSDDEEMSMRIMLRK